jgi:NarL family two-component system response regulator YdfI
MASKILLADDSKTVRGAIRRLITSRADFELVGEAENFTETLRMIEELKPQIVVLDLHMPIGSGLTAEDVSKRIRACGIPIVAISIYIDKIYQDLARGFGAAVSLDKMKLGEDLIPAIIFALKGGSLGSASSV